MSINAISPLSSYVEPSPVIADPRLQANEGQGDSCFTTAMKIAGVAAAVIASIASFVFLGPLGLVVTLALGAGALFLFHSCFGGAHDHSRDTFRGMHDPHVPVGVGRGRGQPDVQIPGGRGNGPDGVHIIPGGGHIVPPPPPHAHGRGFPPPYVPHNHHGNRPSGPSGHIRPGGGHL